MCRETTNWLVFLLMVRGNEANPFVFLVLTRRTGLHLTPAGNRIVYEEIMKVIQANWPDQTPEILPMVFPAWGDAPK